MSNKDNIRQAIIEKIKKISKHKKQHPNLKHVRAKFIYFKEPIGVGDYRFDKLDNDHPYHENRNYNVSWKVVSDRELIEMYQKLKMGETYCFFLENNGNISKQDWNNDSNNYVTF